MIKDGEYFFVNLLLIFMSSFEKFFFSDLVSFFTLSFFVSFLLSCMRLLGIWDV